MLRKRTSSRQRYPSRRIDSRLVFFILPFLAVAGFFLAVKVVDRYWPHTSDADYSETERSAPVKADRYYVQHADGRATAAAPKHVSLAKLEKQKPFTRPAEAISQSHSFPDLPSEIKAEGPVATRLLLSVASDGTVTDAGVVDSTGSNWLDQQAIDWVKAHWRYRPAMIGTRRVESSTEAMVFFEQKRGSTRRPK